ncbi:MAG TPA: hypothetical protein PLO29_05615 [Paludibacter sp.]|jgi:hypothetical protein|nr:MAG: hypothetical protein BWX92_03503 [Deltaproteobacteria bacterium ADurb.Bin135]HQB28409.1 hypothetical protein [Paludibacter sp.]
MQISKLLEIATAKYEDFYQIYEAKKDEDAWKDIQIEHTEKEKIVKAVELVDEQTYELMVPPLKRLKSISNKYKPSHENQKNCDFENPYSILNMKISSPKMKSYAWFGVYYEYLSKGRPWGLGAFMSITGLSDMTSLSDKRKDLENQLQQEISGSEWATTEEMRIHWENIGISKDEIQEEIEEGGMLRLKQPLELTAGKKISEINERIFEIGKRSFIQKIPELKAFWKNNFR